MWSASCWWIRSPPSAAARAVIGKIRATPGMAASERLAVTDPANLRSDFCISSRDSMLRKFLAMLCLCLGLAQSAAANPAYDLGPAIGSKAPPIGMPQDERGAPRSLQSLMGEKGVVLFFF